MAFLLLATGEVVSELPFGLAESGYEEVPDWDFLSRAEFESPEVEIEDRSWVVAHYLRKKAHYEAELAGLKAVFEAERRRLVSTQACLDWRYLEEVEFLAGELLAAQAGKKQSVRLGCGTVGWRKDTKIVVSKDRLAETVDWCEEHGHESAIKVERSILKKGLPVGETIPGVSWPSGMVFFARPSK